MGRILFIVLFALVNVSRADDPIAHCAPLPLDKPVTAIGVSEDGKQLVIAHEAENALTIWDVAAAKEVKTVSCPSPRYVLCRGGRAFVANYGQGKISVFDTATWKLQDELLVGKNEVDFLSAPAGSAFKNQILASTHSKSGQMPFLIDIQHDTHTKVRSAYLPTISLDGRFINDQGSFDISPRTVAAYKAEDFLSDGDAEAVGRVGVDSLLYQGHSASYWFGFNQVFYLGPSTDECIHENFCKLVVPDVVNDLYYGLDDRQLVAYRTTMSDVQVGTIKIDYETASNGESGAKSESPPKNTNNRKAQHGKPAVRDKGGSESKGDHDVFAHRSREDGRFDTPIAVTLDQTTTLFIPTGRKLWSVRFPAFPAADAVVASNADTSAPSGLGAKFPAVLNVGQSLSLKLSAPNAKITLVQGPKSSKLADDGTLNWTPTADETGDQSFKFRVDRGGEISFERASVNVAALSQPAVATATPHGPAPSPVQPSAAEQPLEPKPQPKDETDGDTASQSTATIALSDKEGHETAIVTTLPGKVCLLDQDSLRILDPTGAHVAQTLKLPRHYHKIAERATAYVALSNNTLDVLDKKSLTVTKSIPLGTAKTFDLAIDPHALKSFVSIHDDEGGQIEDDNVAKHVIQVDETTGAITKVAGAVGQWILVDPQGQHLYVALHFLYKTGETFNAQMFDFVPEYGDVDTLQVYTLAGDSIHKGALNKKAGTNGRSIRMAADGKAVAYVSAVGTPAQSYAIPAFDPADPTRVLVTYAARGSGALNDFAFHPTLPLVAVATEHKITIYDRATGDEITNKVPDQHLKDRRRVMFSQDGRSVLADVEAKNGRRLVALPLNLTATEQAALKAEPTAKPR